MSICFTFLHLLNISIRLFNLVVDNIQKKKHQFLSYVWCSRWMSTVKFNFVTYTAVTEIFVYLHVLSRTRLFLRKTFHTSQETQVQNLWGVLIGALQLQDQLPPAWITTPWSEQFVWSLWICCKGCIIFFHQNSLYNIWASYFCKWVFYMFMYIFKVAFLHSLTASTKCPLNQPFYHCSVTSITCLKCIKVIVEVKQLTTSQLCVLL